MIMYNEQQTLPTDLEIELANIDAQITEIDRELESTMYRSTSTHRQVSNGAPGRIEDILEGASPEALDKTLQTFTSDRFVPKVHLARWRQLHGVSDKTADTAS